MNEEKCYDEGWRAFQSGVNYTNNPYRDGSIESQEWNSGWSDAAIEDNEEEDYYTEKEEESW